MNKTIEKAIERAGGIKALARAIGVKHQSIYNWTRVPAERVIATEKASGIHRSILRPDLYPPAEYAKKR